MNTSDLCEKYKINSIEFNYIIDSLQDKKGLNDILFEYPNLIPEQIYTVCSAFCREELDCTVNDLSPVMHKERKTLLMNKYNEIQLKKDRQKVKKELVNIFEDVNDFIRESKS